MSRHNEESTVLWHTNQMGYQTTQIPTIIPASKQIPFCLLRPYACSFSKIDSFTVSNHYG